MSKIKLPIKNTNPFIYKITEQVQKLPINERITVISLIWTPSIEKRIKKDIMKNKEIEKYFKTIRKYWEKNTAIDENDLEEDVEKAVSFARNKLK